MRRIAIALLALCAIATGYAHDCNSNPFGSHNPNVILVGGGAAALSDAYILVTDPTLGDDFRVTMIADGRQLNPDGPDTTVWWCEDGTTPAYTGPGIKETNDRMSEEPAGSQFQNRPIVGYVPNPKVLGGGMEMNGMVTSTNGKAYWDQMGVLAGDATFLNYNTVTAAFKKIENFVAPNPLGTHGTGGPITFSAPVNEPFSIKVRTNFANRTGTPLLADVNGPNVLGYGDSVRNIKILPGGGCSRQDAWVHGFKDALLASPKFQLIEAATVTRFIYDNHDRTLVRGVRFNTDFDTYSLCARDEVVVAAGVLDSVKLLLINGIGPEADLAYWNIPSVINNPHVGLNLMTAVNYVTAMLSPASATTEPRSNGALSIGTQRSSRAISDGDDQPDIMNAVIRINAYVSIIVTDHTRTKFRGQVSLSGNQWHKKANMSFNFYYPDLGDMAVLVESFKITRQVIIDSGATEIGKTATVPVGASDADIATFLYGYVTGNWHIHGGASMGTVTDAHFRVIGASHLRVCDVSSAPNQQCAHSAADSALHTGAFCAAAMINDHPEWSRRH